LRPVVCLCIVLRPSLSTLFPYTTLFRSLSATTKKEWVSLFFIIVRVWCEQRQTTATMVAKIRRRRRRALAKFKDVEEDVSVVVRSEEHTSELQSGENLVCRLLLEKKED